MEIAEKSLYIALTIGGVSTIIVMLYGYFIYKAIRNYNLKSLEVRKNYEELKNTQERTLLEAEIEIREQTFQFISKEIHDNITQSLSLTNLTLNCINLDDKVNSRKQIEKSKQQISKSLTDLNNLSKSLDSDLIESYGFILALQFEIDRWNRFYENRISLTINGNPIHLDTNTELILFRIVQESISNSNKHAKAKTLKIDVEYCNESISISIQDDGVGFSVDKLLENRTIGQMAGLKNMRQRAELLGGTLSINTTLNKGTIITASIPIKTNMKKTTIGLVDDHKLLRNALATLINAFRDYEVIIEASNGRELGTYLERIQPDIVILDFNMPEMNGYDTAEWLKQHYPDILVLMLTMYDTELMLIKMLQAGVRGFMKKDIHPNELYNALQAVKKDGYYYSIYTSNKLAGFFRESTKTPIWDKILSEQELKLMQLVCTELTYKEIANEMKLNPRSIDSLRDVLFEKLDVKSRVGLVMHALKHGLVAF